MKNKKVNCDLCGVSILNETYMKFHGICANCENQNKREKFLAEGGMPDDRHLVKVKFRLNKKTCKDVFNKESAGYILVSLISRGVNDLYSCEKAIKIVERNFLKHHPQIENKIKFYADATKISRDTELTFFKNIKQPDYTYHENDPFKQELGISEKYLKQYEDLIVDITLKSIHDFLIDTPDKRFYVFGFDCNAEYGQIQLAMNTIEAFNESSIKYIKEWNYSQEDLTDLKANSGDWKYQGFNHKYTYWQACLEFEEKIDKFIFSHSTSSSEAEKLVEKLMDMFTRALLRVEKSEVFKKIPKEKDFYIQIIDHDENPEDGVKRLERVRTEMGEE